MVLSCKVKFTSGIGYEHACLNECGKDVWSLRLQTEAGKLEAYYIDRRTGTAYKVFWGKFQKRLKFKFPNLINKDSIEGLFTK